MGNSWNASLLKMVGAAVVGMGVGWQAPSVFLTPQVPPLAPVLKMQGE